MGYQDSDILLYFIIIGIIIAVYIFKNKQSPKLPSKDQTIKREMPENDLVKPPENTPLNQPLAQRMFPGDINGVFVFVTAPDPQVHMMAMSLAMQVKAKGKSVRILLCGPGGDLGLKNGNEIIFKPLDKSPQMILKNMIQSGIKVEVCPFYIANSEKTLADLFDGITMAKPEAVADGLLENGIKLFTF
ncbi:DsrEFH domain-containing protein [Desulfonema limicola]|uniref:DsrEFH domain-containing protein n=1 Tax=Desulfonema limicola TaxID=45656 RepID=A0A975GFQ7_9BACT|nr:hypothetical protein [Desulfonema limicola]QTA79512.1 DsrEFH domain-containing protein [Desulfonema limicola]